MKLSHFKFDLPLDLLAEYPSEVRDEARLMVLNRQTQTIEHKVFKDLVDYFPEKTIEIVDKGVRSGHHLDATQIKKDIQKLEKEKFL